MLTTQILSPPISETKVSFLPFAAEKEVIEGMEILDQACLHRSLESVELLLRPGAPAS